MIAAMVLCAGHGVRLRPLSDELPKPLLPVGDRPQLCHVYEQLHRFGARPIVVNQHHLTEVFQRELSALAISVHPIVEPELRGTAGGIAGARTLLGGDATIVWNGDIVAEPPLSELGRTLERTQARAVLAVSPRPTGEGTVGLGDDGRVVRLRGQTFGHESVGGDYIGVAILGAGCPLEMPERGCLVGDYLLPLLARGGVVRGVLHQGRWTDAGTPRSYHSVNLQWLGERDAWVSPRATLSAAVTLRRCVIGTGAVVEGEGLLERVVVWPRATARAPLADAIVTPRGVVRI